MFHGSHIFPGLKFLDNVTNDHKRHWKGSPRGVGRSHQTGKIIHLQMLRQVPQWYTLKFMFCYNEHIYIYTHVWEVIWNFGFKKDSRGSIEVSGMYNSLKWLYLSPDVTCQVDVFFISVSMFSFQRRNYGGHSNEPHIQLLSSEEHHVPGGYRGTYPFWVLAV